MGMTAYCIVTIGAEGLNDFGVSMSLLALDMSCDTGLGRIFLLPQVLRLKMLHE